jgi:hypothetical protein
MCGLLGHTYNECLVFYEKLGVIEQLIHAMPDKSQWPKPTHGFFMHPPLLTTVSSRSRVERFKGNADEKGFKRQHKFPICLDYGHHWHNCKKGKPEDIEAMKLIR